VDPATVHPTPDVLLVPQVGGGVGLLWPKFLPY
jgi:hypothetical protein